jgi:hypothetical protein
MDIAFKKNFLYLLILNLEMDDQSLLPSSPKQESISPLNAATNVEPPFLFRSQLYPTPARRCDRQGNGPRHGRNWYCPAGAKRAGSLAQRDNVHPFHIFQR